MLNPILCLLLFTLQSAIFPSSPVARAADDPDEAADCFDQQYSNHLADLGSLHIIQKVAVIAPLGAFHLESGMDAPAEETEGIEGGRASPPIRRGLVRRESGDELVVYSSPSSVRLEWLHTNILTRWLRIHSVLDGVNGENEEASSGGHSPVLMLTACPYRQRPIYLDSQSFQVDTQKVGLASLYENELVANFRTFESGIFFFSLADAGDLLVAQLTQGRLEVHFDFGSLSRSTITGGRALNDGEWHEMRWSHQFDSVQLHVDGVLANSTVPLGLYRKLDFNHQVEVGGRPEDPYSPELHSSFHGCLARLELNNINLLESAPRDTRDCQMPSPQTLTLLAESHLLIPYSFLPFSVEFRLLRQPTSLLSILDANNATLLELLLDDKMALVLEAEQRQIKQKALPIGDYGDGNWHSLSVKLRAGRLDIDLDGETALWLEGQLVRIIGLKMHSFVLAAQGCYRSTTVDLRSAAVASGGIQKDRCGYVERCSPEPCQNGGKCVQDSMTTFRCQCIPNYSGTFCHTSSLPRSCEDWRLGRRKALTTKELAGGESVTLDLDGGGPLKAFQVLCAYVEADSRRQVAKKSAARASTKSSIDSREGSASWEDMSSNGEDASTSTDEELSTDVTILPHDGPASGIFVDGPTEPGAIRKVLDYGIGGVELDRLIDGFEQCRQHMRFECRGGTRLMTYGAERRPSTWYATRNGQHGLQWGDAPPYSRMCSCAMNASCDHQRACNCDSGTDGMDEGWNSHHQLLPVMQLYVGGTGQRSSANITIGPMRCTRRLVVEPVTFIDRNQQLVGGQTFNGQVFDLYVQVRFAHPHMTIFTWESANGERWFQLYAREGRLVGQLVNAGRSHELVSDQHVNDGKWHSVYWEIDRLTMRLRVDRREKSVSAAYLLPSVYTYILGSRTSSRANTAGFAGQLRNLHLCGQEVHLAQMVRKLNPIGVQPGEAGYCPDWKKKDVGNGGQHDRQLLPYRRCENEGLCVEYFDSYKCNCSMTPFVGERCEREVGMFVPAGSHLHIPWQHPAHAGSQCYRLNLHTASTNVSLVGAKALFAEARFNLSINQNGHLQVWMYDGFFHRHNVTFDGFALSDEKGKDVKFCANRTEFRLTVNEDLAVLIEGNFTFFQQLNVWSFVDKNFTGCISRLRIGNGFPLKNPQAARLTHSDGIVFGSCPYNPLEFHGPSDEDLLASASSTSADGEIHISAIVKSQQRLLLITPVIGLLTALLLALALCLFVYYVRSRPDGVYKTNETIVAYCGGVGPKTGSKSAEPLMQSTAIAGGRETTASTCQHNATMRTNGGSTARQQGSRRPESSLLFSKEYYC